MNNQLNLPNSKLNLTTNETQLINYNSDMLSVETSFISEDIHDFGDSIDAQILQNLINRQHQVDTKIQKIYTLMNVELESNHGRSLTTITNIGIACISYRKMRDESKELDTMIEEVRHRMSISNSEESSFNGTMIPSDEVIHTVVNGNNLGDIRADPILLAQLRFENTNNNLSESDLSSLYRGSFFDRGGLVNLEFRGAVRRGFIQTPNNIPRPEEICEHHLPYVLCNDCFAEHVFVNEGGIYDVIHYHCEHNYFQILYALTMIRQGEFMINWDYSEAQYEIEDGLHN
jgi:hypothetical protein